MAEATTAADAVVEGAAITEGGTTGEITEAIMEEVVIMAEGVGATTVGIMEEEEAEGAAVTTGEIMEGATTEAEGLEATKEEVTGGEAEVMKVEITGEGLEVGIMAAGAREEQEEAAAVPVEATDRLPQMAPLNSLRLPQRSVSSHSCYMPALKI